VKVYQHPDGDKIEILKTITSNIVVSCQEYYHTTHQSSRQTGLQSTN